MDTKVLAMTLAFIINFISCKKEPFKPVLTDNPLVSATDKTIDDISRPFAGRKEVIGFSIAVLQNGKRLFYNYGEVAKGSGKLPDPVTSYEIGSISKTFTALMLTQLLQTKQLSIETRVSDLLPKDIPALQYKGKYMLVKSLLNHTSGLPRLPEDFAAGDDAARSYARYDSSKIYHYLKNYTLQKEPGTSFQYSNLGMGIAGLIVERLSGESYADYLKNHIAGALGLEHTTADFNLADHRALPYDKKGRSASYWNNLGGFKGAGAIYSCSEDLLTYAQMMLQPDRSSVKGILEAVQKPTFSNAEYKLGSGWFMMPFNGRECLVHDGGTGGFRSFIYICPSTNTAVVLLSNNASDDMAALANALAERMIK